MIVAFDSRPSADQHGVGRYARCLLKALWETAGEQDEIRESHRPRGADVFHAPWMQGAMLHSPCPMVVTLHDLSELRRPSEQLRCGGMHLRLRHLALQRATQLIVFSELAAGEAAAELGLERERIVVIPQAPEAAVSARRWQEVARETWEAYRGAVAQAGRPSVLGRRPGISMRRAARARPGWS